MAGSVDTIRGGGGLSKGKARACLQMPILYRVPDTLDLSPLARPAVVFAKSPLWYNGATMTKDQVKDILNRVLSWPAERQADVAHVVELMEEQDGSTLRLSDEQLAEVQRRRAEKNPKIITLAELNARLRRRYGI